MSSLVGWRVRRRRRIESCSRAPDGRLSEPGPSRGADWFVWPWACHRYGHVWVAGAVYVAAADATGEERCAACGVAFWAAEDRVRGRELLAR